MSICIIFLYSIFHANVRTVGWLFPAVWAVGAVAATGAWVTVVAAEAAYGKSDCENDKEQDEYCGYVHAWKDVCAT